MKTAIGMLLVLVCGAAAGVWRWTQPTPQPKNSPLRSASRTDPGGVRAGQLSLTPAKGDELIAFSSGCFWGSEEAYRKMPGIVATAVGYTGGSSQFPSYELAHQTGHLETVLVEFDPSKTPFGQLLRKYWTLARSQSEAPKPNSPYRAAIWTYSAKQQAQAEASRDAVERKLHRKVGVEILHARPFYLAEEYHQQYNEKSGQELCNVSPGDN